MTSDMHNPIANAEIQESSREFAFRTATLDDVVALQQMIGDSLRALGKEYYTQDELDGSIGVAWTIPLILYHTSPEVETLAAVNNNRKEDRANRLRLGFQYLFGPDTVLIHDQTYFILHPRSDPSKICACGGWSFRKTLYGGDAAPSPLRMPEKRNSLADRASIRAIFTNPAWARRGLGTMMMRHCEARAREGKLADGGNVVVGGFAKLEMGATLSGVALYERCGYVKSGRVDVVRCPNGAGIQVVHMIKDLE